MDGRVDRGAVDCGPGFAQQKFPAKPVTVVVPYPAGGSNDTFARELGKRLSDVWKIPVIIEQDG